MYYDDMKEKLDKHEVMIASKSQQIKDLDYEIKALRNYSIDMIKSISDLFTGIDFHMLWLNFDHDNHIFRNATDADTYRFIEYNLFGRNHPYKFIDIIAYGFDNTSYELHYTLDDKEFYISVPIFENASVGNYNTTMFYKLAVKDSECSYIVKFKTRFFDEFVSEFKKTVTGGNHGN